MLPTFFLPILAALAAPSDPPAPAVVAAYATPGAVVFDLDRDRQVTIVLDDDGAAQERIAAARPGGPRGPIVAHLPTVIDRIDATADGAAVIVRGDGRAIRIALTER